MNDDFDPRAGETNGSKNINEFGDFEAAFGNSSNVAQPVKSDDGFADFTTAFSQSQTNSEYSSLNLLGSLPNALPNVIPPPNMSPSVPNILTGMSQAIIGTNASPVGNSTLIGGPPAQTLAPKNNCDLLGDLSDFGNLTIQSHPQNIGMTPNNNLLSTNTDLLDSLSTGKLKICILNIRQMMYFTNPFQIDLNYIDKT